MPADRIVECVPNFSEGRDPEVIEAIIAAVSKTRCKMLDWSSDESHNRSVFTFAGTPERVEEAAFQAAKKALELIDMEEHTGEHPRIGATDVIPFVPIAGVTMADCIAMANRVGARIAGELKIPVYLYAKAASREDRVRLPDIRRGEYEGLKTAIKEDPLRKPDYGPAALHPRGGATAVGARPPLIAYNINLDSNDVKAARAIARLIRESSGGLPHVQAKGILIESLNLAQVTMNLLDYKAAPLSTVFRTVEEAALSRGISIHSSEVIGMIPLDALLDVAVDRLKADSFSKRQVLDLINTNIDEE